MELDRINKELGQETGPVQKKDTGMAEMAKLALTVGSQSCLAMTNCLKLIVLIQTSREAAAPTSPLTECGPCWQNKHNKTPPAQSSSECLGRP